MSRDRKKFLKFFLSAFFLRVFSIRAFSIPHFSKFSFFSVSAAAAAKALFRHGSWHSCHSPGTRSMWSMGVMRRDAPLSLFRYRRGGLNCIFPGPFRWYSLSGGAGSTARQGCFLASKGECMKLPEDCGHIRGICRGACEGKSRENREREPGCAGRLMINQKTGEEST